VVVEKHTEHQVDGQDTESGGATAAEEERSQVAKIKERQKTWVGNVLRSGNLLQRVIGGRIQGKPTRGRKIIGMLSGLIEELID